MTKEQRPNNYLLSFLIPVFNEEKNIGQLTYELIKNIDTTLNYEIIFIDDGSTDNTLEKIKEIKVQNNKINFISFSRNFGHQNALKAGIDYCSGNVAISLDGDLQHPPTLIPKMIEYWQDGFDIVISTRIDSDKTKFLKRYTSRFFYKAMSLISDLEFQQGSADFRLIDRRVINKLKKIEEKDLFFRGLVEWIGYKSIKISYHPNIRTYGKSKYTFRKMLQLAFNGLLGYSTIPLRIATLLGFFISFLSFSYGIYAILVKLFSDRVVYGWASIMAGIYFLGGIQLVCLGICGEYIGRIFIQTKNRPHYIISDTSFDLET